jgi:hypothetical protein
MKRALLLTACFFGLITATVAELNTGMYVGRSGGILKFPTRVFVTVGNRLYVETYQLIKGEVVKGVDDYLEPARDSSNIYVGKKFKLEWTRKGWTLYPLSSDAAYFKKVVLSSELDENERDSFSNLAFVHEDQYKLASEIATPTAFPKVGALRYRYRVDEIAKELPEKQFHTEYAKIRERIFREVRAESD